MPFQPTVVRGFSRYTCRYVCLFQLSVRKSIVPQTTTTYHRYRWSIFLREKRFVASLFSGTWYWRESQKIDMHELNNINPKWLTRITMSRVSLNSSFNLSRRIFFWKSFLTQIVYLNKTKLSFHFEYFFPTSWLEAKFLCENCPCKQRGKKFFVKN